MRKRSQDVILVSSGAIALGRRHLGVDRRPAQARGEPSSRGGGPDPPGSCLQRAARATRHRRGAATVTLSDTEERRRYLNARSTVNTLLALGAVPVINENDTRATAEIRYGDNDRLAARVAQMTGADCLILLSDIDGLYTANPSLVPMPSSLRRVLEVTPQIEAMAGGAGSAMGSGGMLTKIAAAKNRGRRGLPYGASTKGAQAHPLKRIERRRALARWFVPSSTPRCHPQAVDRRHAAAGGGDRSGMPVPCAH